MRSRVLNWVILFTIMMVGTSTYAQIQPPVEKRHIDLSAFTVDPADWIYLTVLFGDLNNDGIYKDFIRYTNSARMQAFTYSGTGNTAALLWEFENPVSVPAPPNRYKYKYVIWDIDADGETEITGAFASSSGKLEIRILDAATGAVERSVQTTIPNPTNSDPVQEHRAKLTVANFRGTPTAQDIVFMNEKNSNGDIWVYDNQLNLLWDTTGDNRRKKKIYAHYPFTVDLDGDNLDELLGTWVFNHDGTKETRITPPGWEPNDFYYDHLDRVDFGDFVPSSPGPEFAISHEFKGIKLYDAMQNLLFEVPDGSGDDKLQGTGDFTDTNPGVEFLVRQGSVVDIMDVNGNILKTIAETPTAYNMDYDGDRTTDEYYDGETGGSIGDPWNDSVFEIGTALTIPWHTPPGFDIKRIYGICADVIDDYREEVVFFDEDELFIYGAPGVAPKNYPSPWTHESYRYAMANNMSDNHPERPYINFQELFTGPTISGSILDSSLTPIPGVLITADGGAGSTTTNVNGEYFLSVSESWSGTLTPSKTDYTFSPNSRSYSNAISDIADQNYTGIFEDTTPPDAPTGLTAISVSSTQVDLDWNNNSESDLANYNVKRATSAGGPYSTIASPTASTFTDTGLNNGTTYYYVVSAVDTSSNESGDSSEVSTLPVVSISATDPTATEAGQTTATFSISRDGDTSVSLTVNYTVNGTATAGQDYQEVLTGNVLIDPGRDNVNITITAIDDNLVEDNELLILSLLPDPSYQLGTPTVATVTIVSDETAPTPGPDLEVSELSLAGNQVAPGASLSYDRLVVINRGNQRARNNFARLVLSHDVVINDTDQRLTRPSLRVPALAAGASATLTGQVMIPADVAPGPYWLGVMADPSNRVVERDESNNTKAVQITVTGTTPTDGPDLQVSELSLADNQVTPGASLSYNRLVVINQGNQRARNNFARLVLSDDAVIDDTDLRLTRPSPSVPMLAAGASTVLTGQVRIPADTAPGPYWLGVMADPSDRVAERDESNNTKAVTITVGAQ